MADTVEPAAPALSPEARMANFFGAGEAAEPEASAPEPSPDADVPAEEASPPAAGSDDEQPEQQPSEDTEPFEELTHLDKTYEVPASLKKAFEENRAMATRAAQTAKQAETLFAHANAQAQLAEAESQFTKWAETEIGEKARLEALATQYKKLDWYGMSPEQYQENRRARDIINEQLDDAKKALEGKRGEFDEWRKQKDAEVISKGQEYLSKVIPTFNSEETRLAIAKQGASLGYTQEELTKSKDPRFFVALHKAAQWDRAQAQKSVAANKVSKVAPVVKAGTSTAANNTAVAKDKSLRARLKQSGSVNDAVALLLHRTR